MMAQRCLGGGVRAFALWCAAALIAGTVVVLAASTTITSSSTFAVAYAYSARVHGISFTSFDILGASSRGDSWSVGVPQTPIGDILVIPSDGVNAPYAATIAASSGRPSVMTTTHSQPFRRIPLTVRYESTLDPTAVTDWIDKSILVANGLFASQRMGIYLEKVAVDTYTMTGDTVLGCDYLNARSDTAAAHMIVYVGPLTSEMLKIGTTCTGVKKIALALDAQYDVLAHEVAHNLRLDHPPDILPSGCVATNIMVSTAASRTDATEGQIVRAHTHSESFLRVTGLAPSFASEWASMTIASIYKSVWPPTVP